MTRRFRAGCGREQDGPDFCRWLASDREAPFARLADLVDRHGGGGTA